MPEVDRLDPFLMTVVSDSDCWLFAGSNGGLTAGRVDADHALFPYRTADKILRQPAADGAVCILQTGDHTWEPWATPASEGESVVRCVSKHRTGCAIRFEETHFNLGLRWSATLVPTAEFGLVRECRIENLNHTTVGIRLLDGWHGLLPPGVTEETYARFSYLAAAYMRHELHEPERLGLYTLNCGITDRAESSESLRVAVAWSIGHAAPRLFLSDRVIPAFRRGEILEPRCEVRGEMGAYLAETGLELKPGACHRWFTVADTGLDHAALVRLKQRLADPDQLQRDLAACVPVAARRLERRIAGAAAIQHTADHATGIHHFANVLFNCMRGGVPIDGYQVQRDDFIRFLESRNRDLAAQHRPWLATWPESRDLTELSDLAESRNDPQLSRLAGEYLPLTFSRRHGDPSRPWNRFSIQLRDANGQPRCAYSGNWRDIFQNWESLAQSYPACCPAMIAVFLNASTAEGYNPYRISRDGFEWEIQDPKDPWSHIGYWGDHQLVYLLRLLRTHERFWPGQLTARLDLRSHSYALIPYEIRGFDELLHDPRHSILFNSALHDQLLERAATLGNDAKLLPAADGQPLLVSLAEKLLLPLLVKLTNLVPGGGIWLNTQRPEWNDGNNALAGWGLSVVTVCHLHAYVAMLESVFGDCGLDHLSLSAPVARLLGELSATLPTTTGKLDDCRRRELMERLGRSGERHREAIYRREPMTPVAVRIAEIHRFLERAAAAAVATIEANRRPDGMLHSYNVLAIAPGGAAIHRLQLMLEGQVAALASGSFSASDALTLLDALRRSELYRPDQHSYLLQPDRVIPPFEDRNRLPVDWEKRVPLLADALRQGDSPVIVTDAHGNAHFGADLTNERSLRDAIRRLLEKSALPEAAAAAETAAMLELWEEVFHHRSFIGRSGGMFAFEGLGSIYWHMVAKLQLAVQEVHVRETRENPGATAAALRLAEAYEDIRAGLGFTKTPLVYGAFPTDPYSHSPRHLGAQQPGMTGQVKEEILTRFGELGVAVEDGCLSFQPRLLHAAEFFPNATSFRYYNGAGEACCWDLPPDSLGFTLFDIPIAYQLAARPATRIDRADGTATAIAGHRLNSTDSRELFLRTGTISRLFVSIPHHQLRNSHS